MSETVKTANVVETKKLIVEVLHLLVVQKD